MAQRSDFDDLGIDAVFFMDQIVHGKGHSRHSILLFRHENQEYIIHSSYSPHGTITRMVDGSQYIDAYGFVNEETVHVVIDTLNLPLSFGFQPELLIQKLTAPNLNVGDGVYRFTAQSDTLEAVFKRFEEIATIPRAVSID